MDHGLASFLTYKAQSAVYERTVEDARAKGFAKVQTFTLESETGMSLRYARFKRVGTSEGGQASRSGRERRVRSEELAQAKVRWEKVIR